MACAAGAGDSGWHRPRLLRPQAEKPGDGHDDHSADNNQARRGAQFATCTPSSDYSHVPDNAGGGASALLLYSDTTVVVLRAQPSVCRPSDPRILCRGDQSITRKSATGAWCANSIVVGADQLGVMAHEETTTTIQTTADLNRKVVATESRAPAREISPARFRCDVTPLCDGWSGR